MKYIVYIRVSTDTQGEHGLGSEAQLHGCMEWIKKNHVSKTEPEIIVFKDVVTGTDKKLKGLEDRPKLVNALAAITSGDILLTYKRDRVARNSFLIALIERDLKKSGACLKCANGEGDGDEPEDVLQRLILDAFAEYEGLLIAKRVRLGFARKKARGERMGHIPYGYMLDHNKNIIVNPEEAKVLEVMYDLRMVNKLPFREIARELNNQGYRNRSNKNSDPSGNPWTHGSTSRVYKNYPLISSK